MSSARWLAVGLLAMAPLGAARADIGFLQWTLVEDPPHALFGGSATNAEATLIASGGSIPLATDIGYQSVDGPTPSLSTSGFVFDPAAGAFLVAVDYDVSFSGLPIGVMSFGFGVGTDGDGSNVAGIGLATQNGSVAGPFSGAARVGDVDQAVLPLSLSATSSGSLFVSSDGVSVTVGAAPTMGASAPTSSDTYVGIVGQWPDEDLLVSLFMRSGPVFAWTNGNAEAVFSNPRVIMGAPKPLGLSCGPADITGAGACEPGAGDGAIDLSDFACYLAEWSVSSAFADVTAAGSCAFGTGGDGVDLSDFACYLSEWALGCP